MTTGDTHRRRWRPSWMKDRCRLVDFVPVCTTCMPQSFWVRLLQYGLSSLTATTAHLMATICRCGHANHRTKRIYLYRTSSPVHSIESECIRQNSQVRWGQGRLRIESSVMNSSCLTDKWRTKRSSNLERTEPKNAPTLAQELRNQFQSSYRSFPTSRAK